MCVMRPSATAPPGSIPRKADVCFPTSLHFLRLQIPPVFGARAWHRRAARASSGDRSGVAHPPAVPGPLRPRVRRHCWAVSQRLPASLRHHATPYNGLFPRNPPGSNVPVHVILHDLHDTTSLSVFGPVVCRLGSWITTTTWRRLSWREWPTPPPLRGKMHSARTCSDDAPCVFVASNMVSCS